MRRKPFNLLLIAFQLVWYGAVVPGHTRGQVALPDYGGRAPSADAAPACPLCAGGGAPKKQGGGDPVRHCAVCFFAAHLDVPPPVVLIHPPLCRAEQARPAIAERCDLEPPPARYRSRAPPAA